MKRAVGLISVLLLLMGLVPVMAQEGASCDAAALTAVSDALAEANDAAKAAIEAGDLEGALAALASVKTPISAAEAACSGLTFSGTNDSVVGPVELPEGIYKATATTDGFISVLVTALSGECGSGSARSMRQLLFNVSKGEAAAGAEALLFSAECSALFEVGNVQGDWEIRFEKVG